MPTTPILAGSTPPGSSGQPTVPGAASGATRKGSSCSSIALPCDCRSRSAYARPARCVQCLKSSQRRRARREGTTQKADACNPDFAALNPGYDSLLCTAASARSRSVQVLQGNGTLGWRDSRRDGADEPQTRDPHLLVPFRQLCGQYHDGNTRDHDQR